MRVASVLLASALFASVAEANVTFQITWSDAAGTGFNDPTYGAQRRAALQYAADTWGTAMQSSYTGETITMDASYTAMGGTSTGATLASAGPQFTAWGGAYKGLQGNVWYPGALANHLIKSQEIATSQIILHVNSSIGSSGILGGESFYYGTDGKGGSNTVDFVSVALHEIGHGLGFDSMINQDGSYNSGTYSIFDEFLVQKSGTTTTSLLSMDQSQRASAMTSGSLYWNGSQGTAANGGQLIKLYAPNPYEPGSSVSHLDEASYVNALMSPIYSSVDHQLDALSVAPLNDIGWNIAVPEPGIIFLAVGASSMLLIRRRQAKAA